MLDRFPQTAAGKVATYRLLRMEEAVDLDLGMETEAWSALVGRHAMLTP
jgi:hypothetical protein